MLRIRHATLLGSALGGSIAPLLLVGAALANPLSAAVTTGSASIATSANKTQIDQKSEDVVIDWSSFNIGAGQTTQFVQPNAQAIAVNRIGGNSPSQILGTLDANGRVVLINGNGMLFGKGAVVNVGSLIATSTGGADSDVLAGRFTQAGKSNASVVNQGSIRASLGGLVALVAPGVTNAGLVKAKFGTVALGGANKFTVDFTGDGLVSFAAQGTGPANVANTGRLVGANVSLTARAAEGLATGVVDMSGIAIAQTAKAVGGSIVLDAGDGGDVIVSNTKLDASGANGGGSIRLGGWNENSTTVDKASVLNASALGNGNGGTISAIAANTSFEGAAHARGGKQSGNGGTIETSGHVVDTQGARIDASAAHGAFGNWSLDPENVTISTAATTNGSLSGGIFTPSGDDSILNTKTLVKALKRASIDVTTGSTGSQAGDITIASKFAWASGSTLTLNAYHSILVDSTVTVTGAGGLNLVTNDGGSGGMFGFGSNAKDRVVFDNLSSALTINGNAYTLVDNIATLASDIAGDPSGYYALANNYNAGTDGTYATSPIGTTFTGDFEGLGNTISELAIDYVDGFHPIGLFANVGSGGTLENINLKSVNVTVAEGGPGNVGVGALVGEDEGTISGAAVTGTVEGGAGSFAGGLVGLLDGGTVQNSQSAAKIESLGKDYAELGGLVGLSYGGSVIENSNSSSVVKNGGVAGGLLGANAGGDIENSYATGNVMSSCGSAGLGGLVGADDPGIRLDATTVISDSYATGNVSDAGRKAQLGGLLGVNFGGYGAASVTGSYATGSVTGGANDKSSTTGGLVGLNVEGSITNSYATGNIGGSNSVGGLVGENRGTISNSYAAGSVYAYPGGTIGGFVGEDLSSGGITNSYWDTTTSGITNLSQGAGNIANDPGITGLSTVQLQSGLPTGFDPAIWGENAGINGGLPYLLTNPPT